MFKTRKRLLCVCTALALLLAVPVHAAEDAGTVSSAKTEHIMEESGEETEPLSDMAVPGRNDEEGANPAEPDFPEAFGEREPFFDESHFEEDRESTEMPFAPDYSEYYGDMETMDREAYYMYGAFAGEGDDPYAVRTDAEPVINVTVPETGEIIVNPYQLEVQVGDSVSREQIVSSPLVVTSSSTVDLVVDIGVTGTVSPSTMLVDAPPLPDAVEKELFLYLEISPCSDSTGNDAMWSGEYTGRVNQVLVSESGEMQADMLTLPAATEAYGASYAALGVFGAASPAPDTMWNSMDSVTLMVTYTFKPMMEHGML